MISFYETESEARQALSDVTLIKWPQMIVTGASVTGEQAKEIIIRTDPFFSDIAPYAGGNDQEFTIRYQQQSGVLAAVSCSDRQVQERVQEAGGQCRETDSVGLSGQRLDFQLFCLWTEWLVSA